jgi:hypothetical protein
MKTEKEIKKYLKNLKTKIEEDRNNPLLREDVLAYKSGAEWALEWVLDEV